MSIPKEKLIIQEIREILEDKAYEGTGWAPPPEDKLCAIRQLLENYVTLATPEAR